MGREIKRVPIDFDWPREERWPGFLGPNLPDCLTEEQNDQWFEFFAALRQGPPTGEGWQVWETVSEGSPVSPVFPTPEGLARHLSETGDDWTVRRRKEDPNGPLSGLPSYEQALAFVTAGWSPSLMAGPGGINGPYEMHGPDDG